VEVAAGFFNVAVGKAGVGAEGKLQLVKKREAIINTASSLVFITPPSFQLNDLAIGS
jgi:hypothetical protein